MKFLLKNPDLPDRASRWKKLGGFHWKIKEKRKKWWRVLAAHSTTGIKPALMCR